MGEEFNIKGEELEISNEDVKKAFEETESSYPEYEFKYKDYHFLELNGEKKPVKEVFRNIQAVKDASEDFGFDTGYAEEVFRELGFNLYNKREHSPELFRECLEEIILEYDEAKKDDFHGDQRMYKLLKSKGPNLVTHILEKNDFGVYAGNLSVKGSAGQGNWADIPWIAILHEGETTTTQEGVYGVYLFDTVQERVTLQLLSGVKKPRDEFGKKEARKRLQEKAEKIRHKINIPGFNEGELEYETTGVGELYGPSTSFYKTYQLDDIPQPEELEDDLATITRNYKKYIESKPGNEDARYWMIHPGKNQEFWERWKEEDHIAIGWDKLDYKEGNLTEQIEDKYPDNDPSYLKRLFSNFYEEMQEGDIVLVCGNSKVLRAAEVTSAPYVSGEEAIHRRDVEWLTTEPIDLSGYDEKFVNKATHQYTLLEFTETKNIDTIESEVLEEREHNINNILDNVFRKKNDIKAARQHFVKLLRYIGKLEDYRDLLNTTYSVKRKKISSNFGAWQLFSIQRSGSGYLALVAVDTAKFDPTDRNFPEFEKIAHVFDAGESYQLIKLQWRHDLFEEYPDLEEAWKSTINFATDNFGDWGRAPQQKHHIEEIFQWIVNGIPEVGGIEAVQKRNNHELTFDNFNITKGLHFPTNMEGQINESVRSALKSGKHIIFTGPPGTGKTKVAKNTAEFIMEQNESVDDYIFTTATADWTTFDTIGGYHPSKEQEGLLEFKAGQFLKCFRGDGGEPVNKWLIIDEINRADIDKAFGQLFSVLSNDNVELPFTDDDGHTVNIISLDKGEEFDYSPSSYYVTSNWRLLATMNTYDKASLYEMSYAFMRRFAFIDVGVPTDQIGEGLIRDYMAKWDGLSELEVSEHLEELANMWKVLNQGKRSIGPAIIKDMLLFLKESNEEDGLINALKLYVLPQLEGMVKQNQKELLGELANKIGHKEELARVAKQRFEIDLNTDNE